MDSARAEVAAVAAGAAELSAAVVNVTVAEPAVMGGEDAPWVTDEVTETSLATARADGATLVKPTVIHRGDALESVPLPPLDTLVARIPAEVREALEELFRAKFTAVRRVPAKHLDASRESPASG